MSQVEEKAVSLETAGRKIEKNQCFCITALHSRNSNSIYVHFACRGIYTD